MTGELISVGTEILLGDILNTNAQYLSRELASLGIGVTHQCTVGDNRERLLKSIDESFQRADMIIFTGGLGPTPDDITKEVCAEYFGLTFVEDEKALSDIINYFKGRNIEMPESNKKQALVPKGARVLYNKDGTAPGFIIERDKKVMIILPGPPSEMKPMFEREVYPYLRERSPFVIKSHSIRTFGIGESAMSEKVSDMLDFENPTLAPYAKSGEALLRITARAGSEEEAEALMKEPIEEIKRRLGKYIYAIDCDSIERAAANILKEKNLTVAFAESCTGGLCGKRITDIPGISSNFELSVVSYSNEIKSKVLKVKKETLDLYGAVSEQTAGEMALGVLELSGADVAVSVTGEAGPTSGDGKEVGLIFIAVTDGKILKVKKLLGRKGGTSVREYNRHIASSNAFNELREFLLMGEEEKSKCIKL